MSWAKNTLDIELNNKFWISVLFQNNIIGPPTELQCVTIQDDACQDHAIINYCVNIMTHDEL